MHDGIIRGGTDRGLAAAATDGGGADAGAA